MYCPSLPVDAILPELKNVLRQGQTQVILQASPGSGKTTRVPPALLDICSKQIWVLEPRRLAAKMSALRVASELDANLKGTGQDLVGWQMRDDSFLSKATRLLFLTEGMLPLKMSESSTLSDVSCVILDEFHERHAQTDIALALILELQKTTRPDLKLIVMSATLDVARLKSFMPNATVINIDVPIFPVDVLWWNGDSKLELSEKVFQGLDQILGLPNNNGHILVFLPGTRDIERAGEAIRRRIDVLPGGASKNLEVLELRASIPRSQQERVFEETSKRKIILATNIAESSLTIPGVTAVIDCGLARIPTYYPWNQMPTLETRAVSQASLIQRAGRAGRTAPGVVLRLFHEREFATRPISETAEILRTDLSSILLSLLTIRTRMKAKWKPQDLLWLDMPAGEQWNKAEDLLRTLDLIGSNTDALESKTVSWPVHPRIARFVLAAKEEGLGREGCLLAAILSDEQGSLSTPQGSEALGCDLLARYEVLSKQRSDGRFGSLLRLSQQLRRLADISDGPLKSSHELKIDRPLLLAYPDRLAKARAPLQMNTPRSYTLCGGGDAVLIQASAAVSQDWIVAWSMGATRQVVTASTFSGSGRTQQANTQVTIDGASAIDTSVILAEKGKMLLLRTQTEASWDDSQERVRTLEKMTYGVLTVSEKRVRSEESDAEASKLLTRKLLERWPKPFDDEKALTQFIVRQELLQKMKVTEHVWNYEELKELLVSMMCEGASSFGEISAKPLAQWLREALGEDEWSTVETHAPSSVKVGAGFSVPVHYQEDKAPWIEARLQNFFGQLDTPKIVRGRVPLTLHLLAPNHRALQVTTDLGSFWKNVYPSLRNEYQRKYPRHYWPEDPLKAEPPVRGSLKARGQK